MEENRKAYPDIEADSSVQFSPLSFQQERVLYLHKLSAEGSLWNRISCKRLQGKVDARFLKNAVEALVERHSALRTRITLADGTPLQSRYEVLDGAFERIDLSAQQATGAEKQAYAILNREYKEPLSLEDGQLFKAVLVRCSDTEHWLMLKLHHIISDAMTLRILWDDLKALYNTQFGASVEFRPLELEYFDYARWSRAQFGEEETREQESYWLDQFAGELTKLDLPTDFTAPSNVTFNGALEKQQLPRQLIKRLRSFSLERRVIPFSTMLSAYYLLLHNYCGQDDIVIGTVFLGRHYSPHIKHLAGFFSNTVALRARLTEEQTVEEFVKFIHKQVTDAYEMQDYPFQRLVDRLDPDREHKRNPLFRAMFNMVTSHEGSRSFEGVHREQWLEPDINTTQVDFFLDFHMSTENSELCVEYNADIFSKATIQCMLRHYITLVEKVLDSPAANARELNMLDSAEEEFVLSLGMDESEPTAFTNSIPTLLEAWALQTPDQAALLFGDEVMSYGQLNKRANRFAATLIEAGVAENDIVAIMLDRSPEMIVSVMAILKVGAGYLPIDPTFPQQRIEYILQDSGVNCLLVKGDAAYVPTQNNSRHPIKCITVDGETSYTGDGGNIDRKVGRSNAAYMIYTSGSTGRPKGVVVEHGAVMNTLEFLDTKYPLAGKTILFKTNFTFDVSCTELFGWLISGARVALLDKDAEKDPARILEAIDKFGVTHINFVPSMLDVFLSALHENDISTLERLEYVFVAGEALKPDLVYRFYSMVRDVRLENLYGPTEAAIYATWYSLPRGQNIKRVPIGKPIANTRSYILDENLKVVPVGVIGELCLSGAGLARGYWNAPGMTNRKFCPNPYCEGERIYRTGDLAKWGDDGQIQYLGRRDGQMKIRGFRVELGEIERKLLACRAVNEVAVMARTNQFDQNELVAYFVLEEAGGQSADAIREEMAAWLPNYMIPDLLVELDQLPRLPSGKVDYQVLPEPERKDMPETGPRPEVTELEKTIIDIAERLLNTTGLNPDSNFFQMGGNSLLTLRLIAALDDTLGTSLSAMDFLELPTISKIAKLIEPSISQGRKSAGAVNGSNNSVREPVYN